MSRKTALTWLRLHRGYIAEVLFSLFLLACAVFVYGGRIKVVRFDSELIQVQADTHQIQVQGLYCYHNPFPFSVTQGLACPIPSGDGLGPVQELLVQQISSEEEPLKLIPIRWIGDRGYFSVRVPARETLELSVCYTQSYENGIGRYILTTTKPWERPLKHGRYELTLSGVDLVCSNYDVCQIGEGKYAFERTQFMPEQDWVFETAVVEKTS